MKGLGKNERRFFVQNSERALWRYSLIAPLLHRPEGVSLTQLARELAAQTKRGPDGEPLLVSTETILRWFRLYHAEGLDGLENQIRSDRGRPRALDAPTRALLLDLAALRGDWTIKAIHKEAQKRLGKAVPLKPVYRLLQGRRRAGLLPDERRRRPIGIPQVLWLADTWYGPEVLGPGRKVLKTYLIAFLDDASRAVMAGQFGLRDDVPHLVAVLRQALLARGLPNRIITDNGSNYRS
jgi:transposase